MRKLSPMTVSPSAGARRVDAIRSIMKLPTTSILGFFNTIFLLRGLSQLYQILECLVAAKAVIGIRNVFKRNGLIHIVPESGVELALKDH